MSTGMANNKEISQALNVLTKLRPKIIYFFCTAILNTQLAKMLI